MPLLKILLLLIFTIKGHADINCKHDLKTLRCVKYLKNYDGDTINFKVPNIHSYFGKNMQVRLAGIDTPEIKTKNNCEKKKGRIAKKLVENLLSHAKKIHVHLNKKKEKYGRVLAKVTFDGKDLGSVLIKNKLAYEYHGNKKPKINWCNKKLL